MGDKAEELRQQILELTAEFHAEKFAAKDFVAGDLDGAGLGQGDRRGGHERGGGLGAGWLVHDRAVGEGIRAQAGALRWRAVGVPGEFRLVANLVALSALTSPKLGTRALKPGDEVITVAAGFPTTVNPIFQNRLVPVFVDVTLPSYEIDVTKLEAAHSPKMKAVMIAHTLGNVFNLDAISAFCKKYNLWLVEDCCDALGST